jgi:hypothetical protein
VPCSSLFPSNGCAALIRRRPLSYAGEVMQHPAAKRWRETEINQRRRDSPQQAKIEEASGEGAATLGWKPFLLSPFGLFGIVGRRNCACVCPPASGAAFKRGIESSLAAVLRPPAAGLAGRPAVPPVAFSSPASPP